jgi:hypothetical protein
VQAARCFPEGVLRRDTQRRHVTRVDSSCQVLGLKERSEMLKILQFLCDRIGEVLVIWLVLAVCFFCIAYALQGDVDYVYVLALFVLTLTFVLGFTCGRK